MNITISKDTRNWLTVIFFSALIMYMVSTTNNKQKFTISGKTYSCVN